MKKADILFIAAFILLICAELFIKYDPLNNTLQTPTSTVNTQNSTDNQQTSKQSSSNQKTNVNTNSGSSKYQQNYRYQNSKWPEMTNSRQVKGKDKTIRASSTAQEKFTSKSWKIEKK